MDSVWQSALVVLQAFQLAFLLVHDWIPLGPLNDVHAVRRENAVRLLVIGTAVSSAPVALALWLSIHYFGHPYPAWVKVWLWLTYGLPFSGSLRHGGYHISFEETQSEQRAIKPCMAIHKRSCLSGMGSSPTRYMSCSTFPRSQRFSS